MKLLPWIMAIMWLGARMLAGRFMELQSAMNFGVLSNVLLILILIFLSIFFKYRNLIGERPTFLQDVKDCMKNAMKYVIGAVLCLGLYYGVLSDDIRRVRDAQTGAFQSQISTDEGLARFHTEHPGMEKKSRDELIATNKEGVENFVSVKSQMLGGMLALTFVSFAYTLLAVFFWRAVVKRI